MFSGNILKKIKLKNNLFEKNNIKLRLDTRPLLALGGEGFLPKAAKNINLVDHFVGLNQFANAYIAFSHADHHFAQFVSGNSKTLYFVAPLPIYVEVKTSIAMLMDSDEKLAKQLSKLKSQLLRENECAAVFDVPMTNILGTCEVSYGSTGGHVYTLGEFIDNKAYCPNWWSIQILSLDDSQSDIIQNGLYQNKLMAESERCLTAYEAKEIHEMLSNTFDQTEITDAVFKINSVDKEKNNPNKEILEKCHAFYKYAAKNKTIFFQPKPSHLLPLAISSKKHLQGIQKTFSPVILDYKKISKFGQDVGVFLFPNDAKFIPNYYEKCYQNEYENKNLINETKHTVGITIGNGSVISLLPEIKADDMLLLDQEPALHYFLLKIKELILNANLNLGFDYVAEKIIERINQLQFKIELEWHPIRKQLQEKAIDNSAAITFKNIYPGIEEEIRLLGNKHFLSSENRFLVCRETLQKKELLPVHMNIFDQERMSQFANTLRFANCKISFMNLTNVADYDLEQTLFDCIKNLPYTETPKIITTSLMGFKEAKNRCFVAASMQELKDNIAQNYFRTYAGSSTLKCG